MKLLTKKHITSATKKQVYRSKESQFGRVVSVDTANRRAIVRRQGSQRDIYIPWSKNFYSVPKFVRVNNSVEIQHIKGNPTKFEIVGDGTKIPTPVDGSSVLSTNPVAASKVITGGQVLAYSGMVVEVQAGTYRINDILYTIPGLLLGDSSVGTMGDTIPLMGESGSLVTLNAAPSSPNYRIDLISIGVDGVIDYTAGTPVASNPVAPSLVNDHVALAYIIVPYGATEIIQSYIGNAWTTPYLAQFNFEIPNPGQYWHTLPDPNTLNQPLTTAQRRVTGEVEILNQYNKPLVGTHVVSVEIESGNGILNPDDENSTAITLTIVDGTNNTFVYQRLGVDGLTVTGATIDVSPMIKVTLLSNPSFTNYDYIQLYDSTTIVDPSATADKLLI